MENKMCSFCTSGEEDNTLVIPGDNAYICMNCILSAFFILFGDVKPSQIEKNELDDDIDLLKNIGNYKSQKIRKIKNKG